MKFRVLFCILSAVFSINARADMAPGPGYSRQVALEKKWIRAKCRDPKNLVICHYSKLSPDIDDCHEYAAKPGEYKFLARQSDESSQFGDEKYCHVVGKDR